MTSSNELIAQCIKVTGVLFAKAQDSYVYRASVAYILQEIKSFLQAAKTLKGKTLNASEVVALERFNGLIAHFSTVIPNLGKNWVRSVLNWPSTHVHDYIDNVRKSLIEICQSLSLDPEKIIDFDPIQDHVNKNADFTHLRNALLEVQQSAISIDNAVDVQQLIDARLYSINKRIKTKNEQPQDHHPTSEGTPLDKMKVKLDDALVQFKTIDIPCEDIMIGKPLGSGGFGTVFVGTRVSTGELFAVKEVRSDKLSISTWASLYAEVANMENLHHRYVLELIGAHIKEPYRIITRFCPGKSLFDRLHRSPQHPLSPPKLTTLAYQVASGMAFLHSNGIVHRDLKTMNILLDGSDSARIADFGLSGNLKDNKDTQLTGWLGTPHYTAPEILARKRYGPKVDSYSYGIVLWEMETGLIPFRDKTHKEIIEHVVTRGWRLPLSKTVPDGLRRLITRCWSENPAERPEFDEILSLFKRGEVYFGSPNDKVQLEAGPDYPQIDQFYSEKVLADPSCKAFPTLVDFFVQNASPALIEKMKNLDIVSKYTTDSPYPDKILLAAGKLLKTNYFPDFITNVGSSIIDKLVKGKPAQIAAAIQFCINVPKQHLHLVSNYSKEFITRIDDPVIAPYIIRFLACLGEEEIKKYQKELIKFFSEKAISLKDQATLDAITVVIPYIADNISDPSLLIPILDTSLVVPELFASFLVKTAKQEHIVNLVSLLLSAAMNSPIEKPLAKAIDSCSDATIIELSDDPSVLEKMQALLLGDRCIRSALLLFYRMAKIQSIAASLANHPALSALIECKEHTQMRIHVLTALVLCEQFVLDTAVMNDILKILVSSLSIEDLQKHALSLIAAMSSSQAGCKILEEAGLFAVFSQLFLSPVCNNAPVALKILRNASQHDANIPQKSLIISCLMQDLISASTERKVILFTLIKLISKSPDFVQEHDIQNSIVPLLSPKSGPVIVALCLQLLDACEMVKIRMVYVIILSRLYIILSTHEMLYPEIILYSLNLLVSMWLEYQDAVKDFLAQTNLVETIQNIIPQLDISEDIVPSVRQRLFILSVDSNPIIDEPVRGFKKLGAKKQSTFHYDENELTH